MDGFFIIRVYMERKMSSNFTELTSHQVCWVFVLVSFLLVSIISVGSYNQHKINGSRKVHPQSMNIFLYAYPRKPSNYLFTDSNNFISESLSKLSNISLLIPIFLTEFLNYFAKDTI